MHSSVRIQIKEVTDVMRNNVQRVMERGERLDDLQVTSDRLSSAGNEFRDAARRAQRRAWMQNVRSRLIIAAITITVILCIIGERHVAFGFFRFRGGASLGLELVRVRFFFREEKTVSELIAVRAKEVMNTNILLTHSLCEL